jgi:ribonuclease P protein component
LVFKLNKESSLKSKTEIEKVLGFGKKVSNKYLSVYFLNSQNSSEIPKRVAVIVGKKNSCPCC